MQLRSPSKQKQSGKAPENQIPPRSHRQENPTTSNKNTNRTTTRPISNTRKRHRNSNCKSKGREQTKTTRTFRTILRAKATTKSNITTKGKNGKPAEGKKPPCNLLEVPLPTQRQGTKMQMETTRQPTEKQFQPKPFQHRDPVRTQKQPFSCRR